MTKHHADRSGRDADLGSPDEPDQPDARDLARQSIGRNVMASLGAQAVSWVAAMVVVALLPRYLGAENIGQLRLATAIWLVAGGFVFFGTDKTVTLHVARADDHIARIVSSTIALRIALWAVVGLVAGAVLLTLGTDSTAMILFLIIGVGAFGTAVGSVALASLQGLENFADLAKVTAAMSVITPSTILLAIVLDLGLFPVAAIIASTDFISGTLQYRYLRRYTPIRWRITADDVRNTARRGLPYMLGGIALVLYREADTIVMATLVDREQIGWYATADRLFGSALIAPTLLMTTMLPVLARVHVDDPGRARLMAEQTYRTLLLLGLPAGIGLLLVSDRLAVVLFGGDFVGSGPVLGGLGLVLGLVSITILLGRYALAIGRERFFYLMLLTAAIATVPLDLLFVPFFDERYDNGAIGGAASFVVTEASILIVGTAVLLPTVVSRATGVRLAKTVIATAVMAAAVYPMRDWHPAISIPVGAVAFLAAAAVLRPIEDHEREMLQPLVGRLGRRVAERMGR